MAYSIVNPDIHYTSEFHDEDYTAHTTQVSKIKAQPTEWLWPGRLLQGAVNILAGKGGGGKSFLVLDIAARVTTGREFPDAAKRDLEQWIVKGEQNTWDTEPGQVLYITQEDDVARTIKPRFDRMGGDGDRLHVMDMLTLPEPNDPVMQGYYRKWKDIGTDQINQVLQTAGYLQQTRATENEWVARMKKVNSQALEAIENEANKYGPFTTYRKMMDRIEAGGDISVFRKQFNLTTHLSHVVQVLQQHQEFGRFKLLIIDPLDHFLPANLNPNQSNVVRELMQPVMTFAKEYNICVLGIMHTRKGSNSGNKESSGVDQILGSQAWTSLSRSTYCIKPVNSESQDVYRFMEVKKNSTRMPHMKYKIEDLEGKGTETGVVKWLDEYDHNAADYIIQQDNSPEKQTKQEECEEWLEKILSEGPIPSSQLLAAAQNAGFSERTFRRAKKDLGTKAIQKMENGTQVWFTELEATDSNSAGVDQ